MGNALVLSINDVGLLYNNISLHGSFVEHLRKNTTLTGLYLTGCGITPSSAKFLAEGLADNKHLEELDISYNEIYDDGIQHIAQLSSPSQPEVKNTCFACMWHHRCGAGATSHITSTQ